MPETDKHEYVTNIDSVDRNNTVDSNSLDYNTRMHDFYNNMVNFDSQQNPTIPNLYNIRNLSLCKNANDPHCFVHKTMRSTQISHPTWKIRGAT